MREKLKEYVRNLFRYAPNNQHNRELEEEILQHSLDRFDDLVAGGLPEDEAYRRTVANLGDVRQRWETEPVPAAQEKRRRGGWIAVGVIGGVVLLTVAITSCVRLFAPRGFGSGQKAYRWGSQLEQNVENWADGLEDTMEQWGETLSVGIVGTSTFSYANADRYTAGNAEISVSGLKNLEIDWLAGSVTVQTWDGDTVSVSEQGADGDAERQLHWLLDGQTLYLRYCAAGMHHNLPSKDLLVRLPKDTHLEKLSVSGTSADAELTELSADLLKFDSTSGELDAQGDCRTLSANTTSGDVRFTGTAERADFDSTSGGLRITGTVSREVDVSPVSGDMDLTLDAVPDEVSFDSTSADAALTLPDQRSFEAELDTVSGDFHCEYPTTMNGKDTWRYDAGNRSTLAELEFDTVSGSVRIQKR